MQLNLFYFYTIFILSSINQNNNREYEIREYKENLDISISFQKLFLECKESYQIELEELNKLLNNKQNENNNVKNMNEAYKKGLMEEINNLKIQISAVQSKKNYYEEKLNIISPVIEDLKNNMQNF